MSFIGVFFGSCRDDELLKFKSNFVENVEAKTVMI